jgi:hypothetical protein
MTNQAIGEVRTQGNAVAVASLILGPFVMSVGDLMHPTEHVDAAEQAAVVVNHASRWYAAHLLLFIGLLLLIPGILALADLTTTRKPPVGYAARVLSLMGVAAFSSVFVAEMLIGRFVTDGADASAAAALLETFQSAAVLGVVMLGGVAFFSGIAAFAMPLVLADDGLRWPAALYLLGAALILAEIITAQVLLSQIGNVVILVASASFAWHIWRRDHAAAAT